MHVVLVITKIRVSISTHHVDAILPLLGATFAGSGRFQFALRVPRNRRFCVCMGFDKTRVTFIVWAGRKVTCVSAMLVSVSDSGRTASPGTILGLRILGHRGRCITKCFIIIVVVTHVLKF